MIGLVEIIEYVGTFAFAISGIRLAAKKDFDLFGAYVVGFVTAIGGGTIRDLCIGEPPFWVQSASYLICTGFALVFVIIFRKYLIHLNITFFLFDTIGLALFTVVGIEKTLAVGGYDYWVAIVMGVITGAAGGVFRDVFINEIPLIFRKEIYAIACLIGGLVYFACLKLGLDSMVVQLLSALSIALTRLVAVRYKIGLPHIKGEQD